VAFSELTKEVQMESSTVIRERVIRARELQATRYKENTGVYSNSMISNNMLKDNCALDTVSFNLLKMAMNRLNLSARAYNRILKVSRTIADLEGSGNIKPEHIAEAIQYRSLDREGWAG
jgi:magnesium chelatase family protein